MNENNLRKRRPYGLEDAPAVPPAQGSSSTPPIFNGVAHPSSFSNRELYELYILQEASSILQCSFPELKALDRRASRPQIQQTSSSASYRVPFKRPRLSTDPAIISPPRSSPVPRPPSQEMAEYHHRVGDPDNSFSLTQCFANFTACLPCATCDPPGYVGIPTTSYSGHTAAGSPFCDEKPPTSQVLPGAMPSSVPHSAFEYDSNARVPASMPGYALMQANRPMTAHPTDRDEAMVYPSFLHGPGYTSQLQQHRPMNNHMVGPQSYGSPHLGMPGAPVFSSGAYQSSYPQAAESADGINQTRGLDIVLTNQKPTQAKRGPFKSNNEREATAETRKIGSCIRCRMQRIRCETNPEDKFGTCLTCKKVSNLKIWRLPCLRYKITDVRLFKPGQVKGHEWTRRWREGVADDIAQWASPETKLVEVTEFYITAPVRLRVRQFVPQEGDSLKRTWVHDGVKKSVDIPPYAIVNLDEAKKAYDDFLNRGVVDCCKALLAHKEKFLLGTYLIAVKHATDPRTPQKERELLRKALQLWMAIRLTTKSTVIIGNETLGMPRDIMDNTSPLQGQIPLPPVMGAQIELILIHQIQTSLRREMLENLQAMTQANKHQTWFTTYLVTFILLHNVALLCQHDAGYARKHGIKVGASIAQASRFAREDMVREYQLGANILLAYFHYCNKGIYPFSAECKEQDLSSLADLDASKTKFIYVTRRAAEEHKKHWEKIRQSNDYENDFYYISQLYEQNWQPQATI